MSGTDEIAIVGVGCRFPGADDLSGFWRVLVNGENHVTEVPADRWNVDHFYDPDENAPGKMYVKKAGFIHGVENWDRAFFGISEQEGIMMDPQQRLVLQCVHMAAEDGGFTRKDLAAIKTGVFIGCMTHDFDAQANEDACATGPYSVTGSHSSILSARVSYVYNLTGPALTIDTACSSSLVAIHLGAQALLSGDVDMMICGGVNCLLEPNLFVALCKANMLARDGQCKAFTDDADGYGRGEGCGIVILKRLKDAISDGNKVWGLIKTGTNQDGQYAKPISAPSSEQQEKLIQDVLRKYNIDKNNITVIEAHGTGTRIGDPIECKALGHTLGSNTKTKYLGSVKTNIGHLEAAAGVAGLIKVLLMMKHKTIVPSLWYNKANENKKLQLSSHGFVVPTQLEVWNEDQTTARMASLNSFGFGGTNAHAVIYDYINNTETAAEASACILPPIVVISAVNEETLKRNKKALLEKLKELDFNLRSLSFTSTCKRDIFQVREAHYAKDKQALIESLMHSHDFRRKFVANGQPPKVVFVFCGVGTVWQDMGNILLGDESFHAALKAIDTHLKPLTRWSIVTKFVQKSTDLISDPFVSHIGLFSYQVALSEMWKKFGVTADAVVGQSVGEVAAAYTAGYLNLESAVQVIFHRSRHLSSVNQGKMIVVQGVDLGKIELSCSEHKLEIAVEISKTSCTVSGEENAIALLKTEVKNNYQDVKIKDLTAACAYHSRFVETAAEQIQKELPSLFPESSVGVDHIPMISTVIGKQVEGPEICSNEYWKRNAREKVLFMSAIKTAVNPTQKNIFLEIGPRSVLTNHMDSIFSSEDPVICISSIAQDKESNTIANATCELFEHGVDINWINVIQTCCHMTEIPNQVLDRHNDLFYGWKTKMRLQGTDVGSRLHPFVQQSELGNGSWQIDLNHTETAFLFEHTVGNHTIIPGAFYAEIAFEIGLTCLKSCERVENIAVSLEFIRPVILNKDMEGKLKVVTKETGSEFVYFHIINEINVVCKGWTLFTENVVDDTVKIDIEEIEIDLAGKNAREMSRSEIYDRLERFGFKYGRNFKLLTSSVGTDQIAILNVEATREILKQSRSLSLHPCLTDTMIQSSMSVMVEQELNTTTGRNNVSFLPVAINSLQVHKKPVKRMKIIVQRINTTLLETVEQHHFRIILANTSGEIVAEIPNYTTYRKKESASAPCELRYKMEWQSSGLHDAVIVHNKTEGKYMFFGQDVDEKTKQKIEMHGLKYIDIDSISDVQNHLQQLQSSDTNAMLVYLKTGAFLLHDIGFDVKSCLDIVIDNCLFVTEFIKYCDDNHVQLYLVTENTQLVESLSAIKFNPISAAVWGFVRSVIVETRDFNVTLIDIQPSLFEIIEKLVTVVQKQTSERVDDMVITPSSIHYCQFAKVPRQTITPRLRKELSLQLFQKQMPMFEANFDHEDMYLTPSKLDPERDDCTTTFVIQSAVVPIQFQKELTVGDASLGSHALQFTEHIGFHSKNDDSHESVALYLSRAKTTLNIPKCFIIKFCDLNLNHAYTSGLLTYAALFFHLASVVDTKLPVCVLSKKHSSLCTLLKKILVENIKADGTLTEFKDSNNVCVVTFENVEGLAPLIAKNCRHLVCLNQNLTAKQKDALSKQSLLKTTILNLNEIFSPKCLRNTLNTAAEWIRKNADIVQTLFDVCASEPKLQTIPVKEIRLLKDDGLFLLPIRRTLEAMFDKNGVYIVTGGLTGLGWELALLLAEKGAGTIVLMQRRKPTPQQESDVLECNNKFGCKVLAISVDVSDIKALENEFAFIGQTYGCIKGILHGAGVVKEHLLSNINRENIKSVLEPKILGLLNLHAVAMSINIQLDLFVVASSIMSVVGMPGHASYGASNSFVDAFMEWRRGKGLPGQSINWGALEVGMASRSREKLQSMGHNFLSVKEIRSCFIDALMQNSNCVIYAAINWELAGKGVIQNPKLRSQYKTFLSEVAPTLEEHDLEFKRLDIDALKSASPSERREIIGELVLKVAGGLIVGERSEVLPNETFVNQGFDSISRLQFVNILRRETDGQYIQGEDLLDKTDTVNKVIDYLVHEMFEEEGRTCADTVETTVTFTKHDNI